MDVINASAIFITLSAALMYINFKFLKFPVTIGLMIQSLVVSILILILGALDISFADKIKEFVGGIDFNTTLMGGMLSFLLFAGSLHIDISDLLKEKKFILILATLGVVFCTLIVGFTFNLLLSLFGFDVPLIWCLLFGALISPTDPIAVLGIFSKSKSPKNLETIICGESLFNDGVGVVVFTVILGIAMGGHHINFQEVAFLFFEEAIGGILYGFVVGYIFYRLLKSVDNYPLEILLTLSLVSGGYALATFLHLSGPLAMVVAGLFIGNHGKTFAMSDATHKQLFSFWELIDEFLNAVLFVFIGIEILAIAFNYKYIGVGLISIPIILFIRFFSVTLIMYLIRYDNPLKAQYSKIITWGGLRGGISIALALSIPHSDGFAREIIIATTYVVVLFSIIVQGLTLEKTINKFLR